MLPPFKIAQISDIHLGGGRDDSERRLVRKNFEATLADALSRHPDAIVFSGDLADHGERKEYEEFAKIVAGVEIPMQYMGGNHDKVVTMAEILGLPLRDGKLCYAATMGNRLHLFLDSSENRVDDNQCAWLEEKTAEAKESEIFLWIHHPPVLCGAKFMDTLWPLKHRENVQASLRRLDRVDTVFCGHYHTAKTVEWEGKTIFVCPATQMQISETEEGFSVADSRPGWQMIEWNEGKKDGETIVVSVRMVENVSL